jgi:predicted metal-dependent phosphoesterase TrpH
MKRANKTVTKIDLHVHTKGSDGWGEPAEYAKAAKAAGLDGIAIADHHFTRTGGGDAVVAACEAVGLRVFRGAEYSCVDGHCLVFGVAVEDLDMGRYPEMQTVISRVTEAGGVAVPAHPYHGYKAKLGNGLAALSGLVAVEGLNGQQACRAPAENEDGMVAAAALHIPTTGGSDAHYPECVGACFTAFEGDVQTEADLLAALRSGKFQAQANKKVIERRKATLRLLGTKSGVVRVGGVSENKTYGIVTAYTAFTC